MFATPHPSEMDGQLKPERDVAMHRNLLCFHYDDCLDVAVEGNWKSWSCMQCALFDHQPQDAGSVVRYATQRFA